MKRLCLLRHAKSDWSDPANDDFSRPLNARGKVAADFMAAYIAHSPYRPDAHRKHARRWLLRWAKYLSNTLTRFITPCRMTC